MTTKTVAHFNFARFLGYMASVVLLFAGFLVMLGFSGPVFIEPHFKHIAQMIMGAGLFSMIGGGYLGIKLSTAEEDFDEHNLHDLNIIFWLCRIIMVLAIGMIALGAWGNYMA
jgi:hypothetical protein